MNKSWKLIPKIVSGEKTIESRWYQTRRAPWDKISAGDTVYFKNAGEDVTAVAQVRDVRQFTFSTMEEVEHVVATHGKDICLVNAHPRTWERMPRYCILVFLKDARYLESPFAINKTGFGNSTAWIAVDSIERIRI